MYRYQVVKNGSDYSIHEIYLDHNGEIEGINPDVILKADSVADLKNNLKLMLRDVEVHPAIVENVYDPPEEEVEHEPLDLYDILTGGGSYDQYLN